MKTSLVRRLILVVLPRLLVIGLSIGRTGYSVDWEECTEGSGVTLMSKMRWKEGRCLSDPVFEEGHV